MSKRFFPQQLGDRKRAKLDISISDHNFPLSQNKEPAQAETWGDDNDDEILLLASQACEEAYNGNDISLLPNYSMCMQPCSTSTQMFSSPGPSTSKTDFPFKKPSTNTPSAISAHLREKCNKISSPFPGITASVTPKANEPVNLSDDFIFSDKVYKGQDSEYIYRQLLQFQEENAKLKSENGKLLEKCITKEGEASILRTQLKTSQVSVDNARLEKIKAQEKVQMEWTEKLAAANNQMDNLRTQLDFKNLEIMSIKEKCKKLESNKVRLTQVTVGNNDISASYRPNGSFIQNDNMTQKKVKSSSNAVQTDDKAHFIDLNKTTRPATSPIPSILPLLLQQTAPPDSLLDYNEKLTHTDIPYKCRVYSTFQRGLSVPVKKEGKHYLATVYEDIVRISIGEGDKETYFNVFNAVKNILVDVVNRLEVISQRMTTAFQREMDKKYIETSSTFIEVDKEDLLCGGPLYKGEQEILARRMIVMLSYVLERPGAGIDLFKYYEHISKKRITECFYKICTLLDKTSTAILYSGLHISIAYTIQCCTENLAPLPRTLDIIRSMISSRPLPIVSCQIVKLVREVSLWENFRKTFCLGTSAGNLKMDYDQGVLLYKKESCHLQILLKQIEASLKCLEKQVLIERAQETTRQLVLFHGNLNCGFVQDKSRCDCQLVFVQVIVYALRICAVMLQNINVEANDVKSSLLAMCRCGLQLVYQCSLRDAEFCSQLAHCEGHLIEFCDIMRGFTHAEIYANMLSELAGTLRSSPEDMPPSFHRQPWLKSFDTFSITD